MKAHFCYPELMDELVTYTDGTVDTPGPARPRWSLQQLVASWLAGHTSPNTRLAYYHDISRYLSWCRDNEFDPLTVGLPEIQMYGEHLSRLVGPRTSRPLTPRTRARHINAVSSFYTYAARAGVVPTNPAREASRPRYNQRHSATRDLTEGEARAMLTATRELDQRVMPPAVLELALSIMIYLGVRVSEVCGIDIDDVTYQSGHRVVNLRTKGNQARTRPLTAQLAPMVDAWMRQRPTAGDSAALLTDHDGQRITYRQMYELMPRLAAAAKLAEPGTVTPHSTRHAFNTIARAHGANLEQRQSALGHASPLTTQIYDHTAMNLADDPAHLVSEATYTPTD